MQIVFLSTFGLGLEKTVEMLKTSRDIAAEAKTYLIICFGESYDGVTCSVCGSEKWASSPFCRSCCIRLQRAKMMRRFTDLFKQYGRDWRKWPRFFSYAPRYWDTCRDYLINGYIAKRKREDDDD